MGDSPDTKRAKTIYSSMVIRIDPKNRNFEQSYRGCTNDFISRELFLEWCLSQEDFYKKDERGRNWEIDKDILFPRNRSYSAKTCCFAPRDLNSKMKVPSKRGQDADLPIGVYKGSDASGRFYVRTRDSLHKSVTFYNAFEAHKFWIELQVKRLEDMKTDFSYVGNHILGGINKHIDMYQICLNTDSEFRS